MTLVQSTIQSTNADAAFTTPTTREQAILYVNPLDRRSTAFAAGGCSPKTPPVEMLDHAITDHR